MENKARCNIFIIRVPKLDNRKIERDYIWKDGGIEL